MTSQTPHRSSLEEEGRQILEECRVLAAGVEALIGFQLLSLLTPALYERLDASLRALHLSALVLVVVAMFLLLTPSAYHRLAEAGRVTAKFLDAATALVGWGLAALRLGIVLEIFTAARALGVSPGVSAGLAGGLFMLSWTLWSVYPRVAALRLAPHAKTD